MDLFILCMHFFNSFSPPAIPKALCFWFSGWFTQVVRKWIHLFHQTWVYKMHNAIVTQSTDFSLHFLSSLGVYYIFLYILCILYLILFNCLNLLKKQKNKKQHPVPFFPFLFIWIPPLSCLPFPHRAPPSPQSPDNSSVVKRHPPSNRPDHGEWGLLGLWHFQLGGGDPETVRLNLFNAAGLICVFFGGGK